MSSEIVLIYVGAGFADGVPARDLTEEDVQEYGGLNKLLKTGLYVPVKSEKPRPSHNKQAGPGSESKGE